MTEAEWLSSCDPERMLAYVRPTASERKLRLFACACCRRIWGLISVKRGQAAVAIGEHFADGLVGREELADLLAELLDLGVGLLNCPLEARDRLVGRGQLPGRQPQHPIRRVRFSASAVDALLDIVEIAHPLERRNLVDGLLAHRARLAGGQRFLELVRGMRAVERRQRVLR